MPQHCGAQASVRPSFLNVMFDMIAPVCTIMHGQALQSCQAHAYSMSGSLHLLAIIGHDPGMLCREMLSLRDKHALLQPIDLFNPPDLPQIWSRCQKDMAMLQSNVDAVISQASPAATGHSGREGWQLEHV